MYKIWKQIGMRMRNLDGLTWYGYLLWIRIGEFLKYEDKLMDDDDEYWDDYITKSLQYQRIKYGGCSIWRQVGISKMVNLGKWNTLYPSERKYFKDGVKMGVWNKKGERLEDNNN